MTALIIIGTILFLLIAFAICMAHANSESERSYRRARWES